jgi:hypothetical protein
MDVSNQGFGGHDRLQHRDNDQGTRMGPVVQFYGRDFSNRAEELVHFLIPAMGELQSATLLAETNEGLLKLTNGVC